MGILSDFFVASPEQIATDQFESGPAGSYPTVESKGITEIELEELLQILRTGNVGNPLPLRDDFPLVLTCPSEEAWVFGCPSDLRDALAGATENNLADYASRWAATEQSGFHRFDETSLLSLLADLADLSRQAQTRNESLYLWISL